MGCNKNEWLDGVQFFLGRSNLGHEILDHFFKEANALLGLLVFKVQVVEHFGYELKGDAIKRTIR
jgi:hypothetical protein